MTQPHHNEAHTQSCPLVSPRARCTSRSPKCSKLSSAQTWAVAMLIRGPCDPYPREIPSVSDPSCLPSKSSAPFPSTCEYWACVRAGRYGMHVRARAIGLCARVRVCIPVCPCVCTRTYVYVCLRLCACACVISRQEHAQHAHLHTCRCI